MFMYLANMSVPSLILYCVCLCILNAYIQSLVLVPVFYSRLWKKHAILKTLN